MAIDSVGSAAGMVQQQLAARQVQAQAQSQPQASPPQLERPRGEDNAPVARESQPVQAPATPQQAPVQQAQRSEPPEPPEPPKPVVNAQGQKTGTIINTSA